MKNLFHHEWKFLEQIKEAAQEALELIEECEALASDIEGHEEDIESALEYLKEGGVGEGHEEDLELSKKYLEEARTEYNEAEQKRKEAFSAFRSLSGISLNNEE